MIRIKNREQLDLLSNYSFFSGKTFDENKTTVYVCKNSTCSLPLEKLEEIEEQI